MTALAETADTRDAATDLCRARAEILQRARADFGANAFDEFLYDVVAASLTVVSDLSAATPPNELRRIEEGCK